MNLRSTSTSAPTRVCCLLLVAGALAAALPACASELDLPADAAEATAAQLQAVAGRYFTPEQLETGRRHISWYRVFYLIALALKLGLLALLCAPPVGRRMLEWCRKVAKGRTRPAQGLYLLGVWFVLGAGMLPLWLVVVAYRRAWGEPLGYGLYLRDWLVGWGFSAIVMVPALAAVVFLRARTRWWPVLAWAAGSVLAVALTYGYPIIYAPLFNTFWPVTQAPVLERIGKVAEKGGIEVDQVLWTDASRRTRRGNAYFVGWGGSRQIVLYNTVAWYDLDSLELLLAHEIGHWRRDHVVKGLIAGTCGGLAFVLLLPGVLRACRRLPVIGHAREQPHVLDVPQMLLVAWTVLVLSAPIENAVSRRFEVQADRESLELTGDPASFVRLEVLLSLQNESDVVPPAFIEWWLHTHPSTARRIAAAEIFARERNISLPGREALLGRRRPAVRSGGLFPPPPEGMPVLLEDEDP